MANARTLEITSEVVKEDGKNRVAKTTGQAGVAGAAIVVGLWFAHQAGWHGDMPPDVVISMQILLTSGAAFLTNLSKLRGHV